MPFLGREIGQEAQVIILREHACSEDEVQETEGNAVSGASLMHLPSTTYVCALLCGFAGTPVDLGDNGWLELANVCHRPPSMSFEIV
jgi:hypothetical protein